MMFEKILIANRGEIACRIIQTAKKMGIRTVAIYSDADAQANHVQMADEAFWVGTAQAADSYLQIDKIIEICQGSGAQAVHPGYGFLSENAEFAEKLSHHNIVFIGPPVQSIKAMGSKSQAKAIMEDAQVPLVKGYHGDNQDDSYLHEQANRIGYPVLIKATAGGGGKGMRVAQNTESFLESLESCRREAKSAFNDDKVLVEKYLTKPRHVEIQVFADQQGNAIHLFERDCSVQRRHQKVIEEAPAPGLSQKTRDAMGQVAIQAAQAIHYVGAGTIEFLYDEDESFYFMEMNTRLQVEHPVTEMITDLDLVEWQIRIANGEPLPKSQKELSPKGHAFEVRVYAEDPDNDFLPVTGQLSYFSTPSTNRFVRIDTGVKQGDHISVYYDPMIAKLIVWDETRDAALSRLRKALSDFYILGTTTNISFLKRLAANPDFAALDIDTGFIEKHKSSLLPQKQLVCKESLGFAVLHFFFSQEEKNKIALHTNQDTFSPWQQVSGWRLNQKSAQLLSLQTTESNDTYVLTVNFIEQGFEITFDGETFRVSGQRLTNDKIRAKFSDKQITAKVVQDNGIISILTPNFHHSFSLTNQEFETDEQQNPNKLLAPMPGKIIRLFASSQDAVTEGQALVILEAMKMEHTITAPFSGKISESFYTEGDLVEEGAELIIVEPLSE
ncbi:MAG: acetyl/propionyl/methylcrotonyl-CoA carboxylase subunit alpha [Pseudomonadota bacterium]